MANRYALKQNQNEKSSAYGKYYARAVNDEKFTELSEIADFIQKQATVKRSDVKAVLDELGEAIQHYLGQGRKVKIEGLGVFKPGIGSDGVENITDFNPAQHLHQTHLIFTPATETVGKRRIATAIAKVTWEMVDVAVDSKGNSMVGRVAIQEARAAAANPEQNAGG